MRGPDITDLRECYAGDLGQAVRRIRRQRLRSLWPSVAGMTVLGVGYATPYLRIFEAEADRVLAAMPGPQGVVRWPRGKPGRVMLVDEEDLPLPDACVDRLLLMPSLEHAENVRHLLRDVWRVLPPQGRPPPAVPQRRGLCAHLESTPSGNCPPS